MPLLTDFLGNAVMINGAENIEIEKINVYKSKKEFQILIKPDRFLCGDEIECINNIAGKMFKGYRVSCSCNCKSLELNSDVLGGYATYIISRIVKGHYICKGMLYDSVWKMADNKIIIYIQYGGLEILKEHKCDTKIRELLFEETGKNYDISFVNGSNDENIAEVIQKRYMEIKESEPVIEEIKETLPMPIPDVLPLEHESTNITGVIKGKKISGDTTPIAAITASINNVIICGDVLYVETKELKSGRVLVSFAVTDYTSSIKIKMFEGFKADDEESKKARATERLDKIKSMLKKDIRVMINGRVTYDDFEKEVVIMASSINQLEKYERVDNAPVKRVELHMHSQMSAMDAMTNVKSLVSRAIKWGHKAVAITDHGVAQAFPDAFSVARKSDIKMIYGIEGYLRGETLSIAYNVDDDYTINSDFVVFDIETTGLSPQGNKIIEVGAVKIKNRVITNRYNSFVNPGFHIPENITELTSITDEMVKDAPDISVVMEEFCEFAKGCVLVAHNANFDVGFMRFAASDLKREFDYCYLDTLDLCRALFPDQKRHGLAAMVKLLAINLANHHRAVDDAEATAEVLKRCFDMLDEMSIQDINDLNTVLSSENEKKIKNFHIIILAQTKEGLENLYHIISDSHMKYFYRKPIIPRSLINKYRKGLIIGSACEAGELYTAVLNGKKEKEIDKIASFYDYLEIQPDGNNEFLIRNGRVGGKKKLQAINKQIIGVGKRLGKPVVATCDVHFIDPQDEIFRRVIMDSQGFEDADKQAPLYFRTTEEMLEEFSYLGEELAYEVVVENTNKIADMIDNIMLLPDEPHTPKMDGAEEDIVNISMKKAISIYGDPLPDLVKARIDRELGSIIKHGFSVLYIIAQKLVWKSLEDGYLVGSRGSVGSSFIAFLLGITEVNALQPHYICPNCKHIDFIKDGSVGSGMDMKDEFCPECGTLYNKDGHDIPFETFLGFDGDKEPDIDLNFSGDYQPKAHKYTEVLFGEGFVFRAGTIGTVAEKTAYGFVKKYFDKRNLAPSEAEINRLVAGCTGVKRTTGQHPGGIMVVPRDEDIHWYCPIQHPADDTSSEIITTHFDYHSISGRLLKLDILGHDDPTVIRMLEDLTGLDATTIKIGDPETMSIFTSTTALGVTEEEIFSKVGSYGVPEFGTGFVRKMLVDTKPTTFAELVRISGLSHGTDVWLNNAQDLVQDNTATLKEVICTRDDIMTYLIYAGLPKKESFVIMESVRKGKGLTPEFEALMRENNVPEWYISSCKKIKYMFPKAHATAYVMMAFRIAYYKVHYPKEFYTTYFTVRADDFDASLMTGTKEQIRDNLIEYSKMENPGVKEKNITTILEMCNEMYCRGIEFLPIDLYKSDSVKFIPSDNGILPPLNTLPGLGNSAAQNVVDARKDGEFFSVEDLRLRTKISKSVIELLRQHGCLKGIPETDQVSMFKN